MMDFARKSRMLVPAAGLLCALAAMVFTPINHLPLSPSGDALNHCEYIASAAEALGEGQWLLREIPRVNPLETEEYGRYPLFQFYSVLPYTLGGILVRLGLTPYHALALLVFTFFWLGFAGSCFFAARLGLSPAGSLVAAGVFTLAPYHLADWYARFAFPELAAFCLMPWVFWAGLVAAREATLMSTLILSLVMSALILTHNIFHLWGLAFLGVFLAVEAASGRARLKGLGAVMAAYILALACCAAFFAPVFFVARYFYVSGKHNNNWCLNLTPLWVLLSPFHAATEVVGREVPLLSLQVGLPALAAAAWNAWRQRWKSFGDASLVCFALAFLAIWPPVNLWPYSGPLLVIQFPYRLLMFTALFGAPLAGRAWEEAAAAGKWRSLILLAVIGLSFFNFSRLQESDLTALAQRGQQAQNGTAIRISKDQRYAFYRFTLSPSGYGELAWEDSPRTRVVRYEGGLSLKTTGNFPVLLGLSLGRATQAHWQEIKSHSIAVLPALWYPWLYQVKVDGKSRAYGRAAHLLAVELFPGDHILEYELTGMGWANRLSLAACLALAGLAVFGWRKKWTKAEA